MSDEKEEKSPVRKLSDLIFKNEYRSDFIIFIVMAGTFVLQYFNGISDEVFGTIIRWGMILVAIEYVGHEAIEAIIEIKSGAGLMNNSNQNQSVSSQPAENLEEE